jgi:hypothetical protein
MKEFFARQRGTNTFWNAAFIPSLALWLDASDLATLTFNGSNISAWTDKSATHFIATQPTAIDQPLYVANGFNNLPTLSFPQLGSTQGFTITGGIPIGTNADRTLFLVINENAGRFNSEVIGASTGDMVDLGTFNRNQRLRCRSNVAGDVNVYSATNSVTYGIPHVITVTDDAANGLNAWIDSVQILTGATRAFNWDMALNLGIAWSSFNNREFGGDLSELIVCGKLSTGTREKQEGALFRKWGF